ncbi:MAG: formate dehydrogenase [Desulfobulbaceae bacterium A2]|nr:MAG: formate dehydrogenase [Desulfobulbaceae bacterium A2]
MKHDTVCRLCSSCCPVTAEVIAGRLIDAQRKSLLGPERGFGCAKLRAAAEIVYSDQRLLTPLIRESKEGILRRASWDEALELVAAKFLHYRENAGPQSVAWLRGMAADWGAPWDYANRLMNHYGSPNTIGNGSVCFVAREMAHSSVYGVMAYPEPRQARCILVWGKHDRDTALGMAEAIALGRDNGAALVVVDPIATPLTRQADIWLQIKPGHDGLLAMAMIQTIIAENLYDHDFVAEYSVGFPELARIAADFSPEQVAERIWLTPESIRRAARLYAGSKPSCIVDGNGLDMQLDMFQATRAVALLRGLCGNIDRRGGDVLPQPIRVRNIQDRHVLAPETAAITADYPLFDNFSETWGRQVQSCVVDAILEQKPYPLRMVVVQSGNPVVTMADSARAETAFAAVDCLVVIDMFLNRTGQLADVILPASSCFEKTQLNRAALRNNPIILQEQVIEPLGASRPDWWIVFELARRLGLDQAFPWRSAEEAMDFQLAPTGVSVAEVRRQGGSMRLEELRYEKYRDGGFATASGKFEFFSPSLAEAGFDPVPYASGFPAHPIGFDEQAADYPLIGISGARDIRFTNSQFRHIPSLLHEGSGCAVDIHPQDAKKNGIAEGDQVTVESPRGAITMQARIARLVHPGSIRIAWGWGEHDRDRGLNLLTDDSRRNPVSGTPAMRSFRCRLRKTA